MDPMPTPTIPAAPTAAATFDVPHPVLTQSWSRLTYLHWPYDPEVVRPFLPRGIEPDVVAGSTWVGLIPFAMRRLGFLGVRLPYVSNFLETNVRLYGIDGEGRRSVVFLSLDADRLLPVLAARVGYRLPYVWSSMTMHRTGDEFTYATRRRFSGVRSVIRVRVGDAVVADPLDEFLTARWGLNFAWYGRTAYAPISHAPWPLHRAELLELEDGLITATGLPPPVGQPRVLHSPGVDVRIGRPAWPASTPENR